MATVTIKYGNEEITAVYAVRRDNSAEFLSSTHRGLTMPASAYSALARYIIEKQINALIQMMPVSDNLTLHPKSR